MTRPTRFTCRFSTLLLALLAAPAPAGHAAHRPAWQRDAEPSDLTYGVYLNGSKVGWMRSTVVVGRTVDMGLELHASVGGMGQVSSIEIDEKRSYAGPDGRLESISFSQRAATGVVSIEGKREADEMVLAVTAGNATQKERRTARETLRDALASQELARSGKVGATAVAQHFDASLQESMEVKEKVVAAETRMLAGVPTHTVRVDSTYGDLGVTETSWLDSTGKVLETQVGGFFVARLEPPDVAKQLDFQQDLLAAAVVKTPHALKDPASLEHLTVAFTGFGDALPPSSERQKVDRESDEVVLNLTRDPALPPVAVSALAPPAEVRPELAPTPFIQSDAAPIRDAAKQAAGGATQVPEIVERLTHYVFHRIRDEYVPAYSNALEALESGRGDCTEHSVLFVALARALGIPSRVAVGIAYWQPGGGFGWHAWAEVWVQGRWYAVDPTWDQTIADATHIKLAGGGPAEQARIVMLLGRLKVTKLAG
jgi:hypothetical protein